MDTLYTIVLGLHNLVRWVVLITLILALVRAYYGMARKRKWTEGDRRAGMFFSIAMDTQLLLGVILYIFLSPITRQLFTNFGGALSNPDVRFFGVEHLLFMLFAVIFTHIGRSLSQRAVDPEKKHRNAAIFYTLAAILLVLGIPWSRPLIPFSAH
jgi:hypothetical protein